MAITSEEQAACDPKLSAKEVTEALRRCRPLPDKRHYDPDTQLVKFGRSNNLSLLWKWGIYNDPPPIEPIPLSDRLSNTRRSLRKKFLKWLLDSTQGRSLFWISDPFLIDKNTIVVQAFAGILEEVCRLGAIVVYGSYNRAEHVILAIIHQLIMKYPPFRRLVLKELINDPTILTKSPCTVFKRLIVQPWDMLACTHPFYLENPPVIVIILRGDRGSGELTDLAELISGYGKIHRRSSLLWLVSSHPHNTHIESLSSTVGIGVRSCEYHVLSTNDTEAKQDVYHLLRDGFQDIRTHHSGLPKDEVTVWPTEDQFTHLTTFISGHYILARTTLRFIGADGGDPKQRLAAWVTYTIGSPAPSPSSSSHDLCVYYHRFLQRLLIEFAPDAIPLLFISKSSGPFFPGPSNRAAAYLVGLSQSEYYRVLEGIRCLLVDPSDDTHLEFCDDGFKYFFQWGIQHSIDFDTFFPTPARLQVLKRCLDILGCARISDLLETMRWSTSTPQDDFRTINYLREFARDEGLDRHLRGQQGGLGAQYFRSFDFRCLVGKVLPPRSMYELVQYLKTEPMLQNFVRADPLTTLDQQFIDKCKGVAIPTNFGDVFSKASMVTEYVLLGHGDQTVLALFTWILGFKEDRKLLYTSESSVSIYSSDMLEEI